MHTQHRTAHRGQHTAQDVIQGVIQGVLEGAARRAVRRSGLWRACRCGRVGYAAVDGGSGELPALGGEAVIAPRGRQTHSCWVMA